ncbi:hypothetical protein HF995_00805 [Sanguibacter hominis ATCC BAA-789]|uniref:Uncharacterized protein n=1 Tax=Sanguibacter hominis ATCC BAA-789 TaxID=1312740 RepID=A0A9X5FB80_9MICO|nr:hypothetical protein [Sanguibacter hominis]NKX91827.1 hypothetical protein [Sanguibacter hominis ATCC BAA-789]
MVHNQGVLEVRRVLTAAATLVLVAATSIVVATPSSALDCTPRKAAPRMGCEASAVINVTKKINQKGRELGSCYVDTKGGTCTVNASGTVTRSVQTGVGVPISFVTANLGITGSVSYTISTSCTSGKLPVGSTYTAWARYTEYRYQVQHIAKYAGAPKGVQTSGWLTARVPVPGGIYCG